MAMPVWAAIAGVPYAADKLIVDPISSAYGLYKGIRDDQRQRQDMEQSKADLAQFAIDPNYEPDYTKYYDPAHAEKTGTYIKGQREFKYKQEAEPVLDRFKSKYEDLAGPSTRFFADPESRQVLEESGLSLPSEQQMQNPYVSKGINEFKRTAQAESDLADVAPAILSGENPSGDALSRFLLTGGEKSTNQLKTLQDLAKQNDEVMRARGRQGWINAGGNSPDVVKEPALRTIMSSAPYGTSLEDLDKLTKIAGAVPEWKTVDTGTGGAGGERQVVSFNPRTQEVGGRVGEAWTPQVPKQTVNVGVKAYESELGKLTAKDVMDMRDSAKASRRKLDALDAIEVLAGDLKTGKLTDYGISAAQVGESLGLQLDPNLPAKEASRAIMGRLALEARNPAGGAGMPGAMSDSDRQFLVSTITPSLTQSKDGRKMLIGTMRRLEQRNIDVNGKAEAYIRKYGRLDDGFYRQLNVWSSKNPLFPRKKR